MNHLPPTPENVPPPYAAALGERAAHLPPISRTDQVHQPPGASPRRGLAWLAWIMILGVVVFIQYQQIITAAILDSNPEDELGLLLMRIQGQYLVGASTIGPGASGAELFAQAADGLELGSVKQRQAVVVLAHELAGADEAAERLRLLHEDIDLAHIEDINFELTEQQMEILSALEDIYSGPAPPLEQVALLTADQRKVLVDELGWFGELALAPPGADAAARADVLAPAKRMAWVLLGVAIVGAGLGLIGFVALVLMFAFAISGNARSGMTPLHFEPARVPHGILAETFALWLVMFFALQLGLTLLPPLAAQQNITLDTTATLAMTAGVFFFSLIALIWPVMRGCRWGDVRRAIGWTAGPPGRPQPLVEPWFGGLGYLMALPLLAAGFGMTLVLMMIDTMLNAGAHDPIFSSSAGPAHPIVLEVISPGLAPKIMLLLVAAVAAPIVEETMFRGVLYGHLRQFSARWGTPLSFLLSGLISSFIFAIIHPQGWVATPALMGLALAFAIVREWRGSLIAAMVIHGISNGIMMSLLIILLSD